MVETQLTPKYISENYKQIFPDSELLEQLLQDFENLYKNNISEIINIESLLSVLHKFGIKKYYNIMLEPIIWKILNLEYQPTNLCEDILHDIINYSTDFTKILQYLIYNITTELLTKDFTFSLPLYKSLYKSSHIKQDQIDLEYAIKYDNLEVVKYIYTEGKSNNYLTCVLSAKYGNLKILKWARKNGCSWDELTCAIAAMNCHLEVLKWARENGCPWNELTCKYAAVNGHLEVLKWARENGCPWNEGTCANAAFNGHLEVLKWARENGCLWNELTCADAAMNGHLEVLKWARKNGCPWNEGTCTAAVFNGHLEVLKWARKNGCPWDKNKCMTIAVKYPEIVKWIKLQD